MNDLSSPGNTSSVLAINAGSSSIRFALYELTDPLELRLRGKIERIGFPESKLSVDGMTEAPAQKFAVDASDHSRAASALIGWLEEAEQLSSLEAVGHRVVHGGPRYSAPVLVDDELVKELRRITAYSPKHLPAEIDLIERFRRRLGSVPQVACFDTAFHRDMPRVAKILPIPRRLQAKGVERYGFHGLSYAFLMEELARTAGTEAARGRLILAHLGNGASLAAVRGGRGIDTSMGFTPAAGLPMSTRSGDLDPGLIRYLAQAERMTPDQFDRMVNHESGLLGVSETSSDLRDLLELEAADVRAAEAVALFCYQTRKWIGAFAAALGGLDTLVFAGGIGENSPVIRARICEELGFLGIELEQSRNAAGAPVISNDAGRVQVRVIRTDEEVMIAQAAAQVRKTPANLSPPIACGTVT